MAEKQQKKNNSKVRGDEIEEKEGGSEEATKGEGKLSDGVLDAFDDEESGVITEEDLLEAEDDDMDEIGHEEW